jgi:hypothetical protein
MNTKLLLASVAVAVVAAALIGVSAAEFVGQAQVAAVNSQVAPPCVAGDFSQVPEWCLNATTGEPYCYQNGTQAQYGYCYGAQGDAYGNGYGYSCGEGAYEQNQNQNQYRYGMGGGMMGRSGYGTGYGCGW